ncbi:MAG: hypothetical protein CMJ28_05915 [Phycisphaerae bacterium]|nr:hypothetical protein [Phycisphaerae bacterium]
MSDGPLTVRDLRRAWKPHKESAPEATAIRMHRMFSWLARAEERPSESNEEDARLVWRWAAWNALYGTWDEESGRPAEDLKSQEECLRMLHDADKKGHQHIRSFLEEHKKLASTLCGDVWLSRQFWSDGQAAAEKNASRDKRKFQEAIREERHRAALDLTLSRVYLGRCQLVHGASTCGSRLNRTQIRRCALFMGQLIPVLATIVTESFHQKTWGNLCCPPQG